MVEILKTLRDTPLPSILVIGGLVFLLLPFLKKTGGAVEIETSNKGVAALIGVTLLISGIGLYLFPTSATNSIVFATATATQTQLFDLQPTATSFASPARSTVVSPTMNSTQTQPNVICNQQGYMPPIPSPPPTGCVLTVEWWYPPNPKPCGLWITYSKVEFQQGVAGYWWYEHDVTVPGHIQAFKQKYDYCEVKDFR